MSGQMSAKEIAKALERQYGVSPDRARSIAVGLGAVAAATGAKINDSADLDAAVEFVRSPNPLIDEAIAAIGNGLRTTPPKPQCTVPVDAVSQARPNPVESFHVRFEWSTMHITLPAPETLTNSGKGRSRNHWSINRRKKKYFRHLDELLTAKLITAPPRRPMPRALIESRMYLGGQMDTDNAMARHKWPIDWLATRGYIANDRHLKWSGFPEQIIKRDGDYRLELTLHPIPE